MIIKVLKTGLLLLSFFLVIFVFLSVCVGRYICVHYVMLMCFGAAGRKRNAQMIMRLSDENDEVDDDKEAVLTPNDP